MVEPVEGTPPEIGSLWDYDNPAETEDNFRKVLDQWQETAEPTYVLEVRTQLARSLGLQDRFDEAHAVLDEVEPQLAAARPVALVRYLLERGRVINSSGEPEGARPLFLQAWEAATNCGEESYAIDALHMVAITHEGQAALHWNLKAIEQAEAATNSQARGWLGSLYNNTGWTYHDDFHEYEKALDLFERGARWREEQGQQKEWLIARWCVARAKRSLGRIEEALSMQLELELEHSAAGTNDGFVNEELAECYFALQQFPEAQTQAAIAQEKLVKFPWVGPERIERMRKMAAGELES